MASTSSAGGAGPAAAGEGGGRSRREGGYGDERGGESGRHDDDGDSYWGYDDLQRRIESLLSPVLSSADLAATAAARLGRGSRRHPHPSFYHREEEREDYSNAHPLCGVTGGAAAYFFYPHEIPGERGRGRRNFHSPLEASASASAPYPLTPNDPFRDSSLFAPPPSMTSTSAGGELNPVGRFERGSRRPAPAGEGFNDGRVLVDHVSSSLSSSLSLGMEIYQDQRHPFSRVSSRGGLTPKPPPPIPTYDTDKTSFGGERRNHPPPAEVGVSSVAGPSQDDQIFSGYSAGYPSQKRAEEGKGGRGSEQMTLAQDPDTGGLYAAPPPPTEAAAMTEQSWEEVGQQIGRYHGQEAIDTTDGPLKKKKKKKKKMKRSKKKREERDCDGGQRDIFAALSGNLSGGGKADTKAVDEVGSDQGGREDRELELFMMGDKPKKKKTKKANKKRHREEGGGKKRTMGVKKPAHPSHPVEVIAVEEVTFDGIEECGMMNAGCSEKALAVFLRVVQGQKCVAWTMAFLDGDCTTPFLPSSKKYCTEKGPRCTMWNCTCDGQVRALQASKPVLCAMFVLGSNDDAEEEGGSEKGDCFLLPLGPSLTSEGDPGAPGDGFERMSDWPVTPFTCDTSVGKRWDALRTILRDKGVTKVTYNATMGLMPFHFHRYHDIRGSFGTGGSGINTDLIIPSIWDLRLASWILKPHSKEEELEFESMRDGFPHLVERLPQRGRPELASRQLLGLITARENLELLLELYPILDRRIGEKGIRSAFDDIEGPLQSVLSAMECEGIGFLPSRLQGIQHQLEKKISGLTAEARVITKDSSFLLSSPQQVSHYLYDILQLCVPKGLATKQVAGSQHRSTSEEALKAIQKEAENKGDPIPIITILLEFRTLNKMLTTYICPLPNHAREVTRIRHFPTRREQKKRGKICEEDALRPMRIHPMWMQTAVRTGRLSCRKPNMQQIPTDRVLGVNPRDSFTASTSDRCLFACDYSQNEIRILAHVSGDEVLVQMFRGEDDIDIYKQMSSACSGKPVDRVTDEERRIYKQVTLAILYGMGVPQVAKKLGVSRAQAQQFFDAFFRRFREVRRWIEQTKEFARRNQFVTTLSGRRRYLDDIRSEDKGKRSQAEASNWRYYQSCCGQSFFF